MITIVTEIAKYLIIFFMVLYGQAPDCPLYPSLY